MSSTTAGPSTRPGAIIVILIAILTGLVALITAALLSRVAHAGSGPALAYSSYLGGSITDEILGIDFDAAGNIYLLGETGSQNFLGTNLSPNGYSDIFVAKLSPDGGDLLYLTLMGGSQSDYALDIQVDAAGNAAVTGHVFTDDFPTHNALYDDRPHYSHNSVLFKLNPSGGITYSTYLPLDVFDAHHNLALDAAGNAYVTGTAFRDNLANQIALLKVSANGAQMLLETYVGGPDNDKGVAVTVDANGAIYLAGTTSDGDAFPVTTNAHQPVCGDISTGRNHYCYRDAVLVVLNASGDVTYASHHGGSFSDEPRDIAVSNDRVFIAGSTTSGIFPLVNPLQDSCPLDGNSEDCRAPRGFATLIQFTGGNPTVIYATYLGADDVISDNVITAVDLDAEGRASVTGYTNGYQFPLAQPLQAALDESFCHTLGSQRLCFDGFVVTFSPTGALEFGTYLGATFDEYPYALTLHDGAIWTGGLTEADDFPTMSNAFQPHNQPGDDGFLVMIAAGSDPSPQPGEISVFLPMFSR